MMPASLTVRAVRAAAAVLVIASVAAAVAPQAAAEEIRLVSGTRYEASDVEILPGSKLGTGDVRFHFTAGVGGATVTLPFDRIDPGSLFGLILVRTKPGDAKG